MTIRNWTLAPIAIAALGLAACNQAGKGTDTAKDAAVAPKPPVATVNGKPISYEAFALAVQGQTQKKVEDLKPEDKKKLLESLETLAVVAQEAEKQNIAADPEIATKLEFARQNALANEFLQKYAKGKTPTDADLKAEYDRQIAAMPKEEFKARHILVKDEATAKDAIAQLAKGAKFEDLAKKLSTDEGSKKNGGDLNWFTPDKMVPPFSEAVSKLKKGETTKEPVKTDFGWHVIRLDDTRPVQLPPFEAVKDRLAPMVQQRQIRDYIDSLRKAAKIEEKP